VLILYRFVGETIMIGENVTCTVYGVQGNKIRIGIEAPQNVRIYREEVFERIKQEQAQQEQNAGGGGAAA
jgi:carbon storage regulator